MILISEILFTLLSIAGAIFVMKKKRIGWMVWNTSNIFVAIILISVGRYLAIAPYVFYTIVNTIAWRRWRKDTQRQEGGNDG